MCEIFDEERRVGLRTAIYIILEKLGEIPQSIERTIENQKDNVSLKNWVGLAASVTSVEEFGKAIKLL